MARRSRFGQAREGTGMGVGKGVGKGRGACLLATQATFLQESRSFIENSDPRNLLLSTVCDF